MTLDVFVGDLELVNTPEELNRIISKVKVFKKNTDKEAGIVLKQNSLGISYRIVSEEQAERRLSKLETGERYVEFYPLHELNRLKDIFEREGRKKYLEQLFSFKSCCY
ncbi:MAG TPA: hypothetical protein VJB89_02545 [Candidatus Nanoarchaeia archaeon]|nr:hypothetical protein [Candidatus Nanoarchaeia archaeon]